MTGPALTAERLRAVLGYDPLTGVFRWLQKTSTRTSVGSIAGAASHSCGYVRVSIDDESHLAHRLAWLHVHGVWPSGPIDHRDGNRVNNAIANLRDATVRINAQNHRKPRVTSSTGLLGVIPVRGGAAFKARIMVDGINHHLGTFVKAVDAHNAYLSAKRRLHEGCTI